MKIKGLEYSPEFIKTIKEELATTLDEFKFFAYLSKVIMDTGHSENVLMFKVSPEGFVQLLAKNGQETRKSRWLSEAGFATYAVKMKTPYFSNNVERDPLFRKELYSYPVKSEFVMPILVDNNMFALMTLQGAPSYSHTDILKLNELFAALKEPLQNMQMYLALKNLNENLIKKIQENSQKEKKLFDINHYVNFERRTNKISFDHILLESDSFKENWDRMQRQYFLSRTLMFKGAKGVGKKGIAKLFHEKLARNEEDQSDELVFTSIDTAKLMQHPYWRDSNIPALVNLIKEKESKASIYVDYSKIMDHNDELILLTFVRELEKVSSFKPIVLGVSHEEALGPIKALNLEEISFKDLEERKDDIILLAQHYIKKYSENPLKSFSEKAANALVSYDWPGNLNELKMVMNCSAIMSSMDIVQVQHLPDGIREYFELRLKKDGEANLKAEFESVSKHYVRPKVQEGANEEKGLEVFENGIYSPQETKNLTFLDTVNLKNAALHDLSLANMEKIYIKNVLERLDGNKTRAAKALGITVKTLYNKLHLYGML